MRSNKGWIILVVLLAIVIAILVWLLLQPAPSGEGTEATSTVSATATISTSSAQASSSEASSSEPLDTQVVVTSPSASSTVATTFTVTGTAPNGWYYEAVFPIQVRDEDDNVVGNAQGEAQSDWTVPGLVPFVSSPVVVQNYTGPANLIVLKDNPSGLPQNDDEVVIPIVIQ